MSDNGLKLLDLKKYEEDFGRDGQIMKWENIFPSRLVFIDITIRNYYV